MNGASPVIEFAGLPLWQGIRSRPGIAEVLPFRLIWDERGFCRQDNIAGVADRIVAAYGTGDYVHITRPPGATGAASTWADRRGIAQAQFLESNLRDDGGAILEIGAGTLYLAARLRARLSFERYVIADPALNVQSDLAEVLPEYFPTSRLQGQHFSTIVAFSSLEHCADPVEFLNGIREHLQPGGRAFLCAPDVSQQFAANDLNVVLHEHISYFTVETFAAVAERCGLSVLSLTSTEDTLWAIVERSDPRPRLVSPSAFLATAGSGFHENVRAKGAILASLLPRRRVAFHGATNGLNNFLHLAGVAGRPELVVFDGDATKSGRFLPACPNPILHASDPAYRDFDVVFVSAMTFFEQIRQFVGASHGAAVDRLKPLFE